MAKRPPKPPTDDEAKTHAAPREPVITMLQDLIGQAAATSTLRSAMGSGRVHHGWVFHGPAGVGKLTTARAFAAALLDPTTIARPKGDLAPEPESAVQQMVKAGTHPDLHIITKEMAAISREDAVRKAKQTNIAKDVLVEFLIEPASKTRVLTGESLMGKVFIVDEAELVAPIGQNTLLKTLEEPPAGTIIILVTSNEDRLLPTIRSRCQRVQFVPLDDAEMDRWFKARSFDLDAKRRAWVKSFAAGSPGMAALAVSCDLYQWHEAAAPMLETLDSGGFPADMGATLAKLVNERAEADVKANPDASKEGANKVWMRRMLAFLSEHFRAVLRERAASPKFGRSGGGNDAVAARAIAAIEAIQAAEGYMASNVNMTMLLEGLAAQLASEPAGV